MNGIAIMLCCLASVVVCNQAVAEGSIVPESGYDWVQKERTAWPTGEWSMAESAEQGFDRGKLADALQLARDDRYFRALLVVRNGFLVTEEYMNGGGRDQSTEIWSATKSLISALIGIAIAEGHIKSLDDRMLEYLPGYPELEDLTIRHVLMHTTGLAWEEEGDEFVGWIESEDWVLNALQRKRLHPPGDSLLYSSGNSHLLSALILTATGMSPGDYASEHLFGPLGINFQRRSADNRVDAWDDFLVHTPGTWKLDARGIEVGAFGLALTAREMAKFGYLYLNKGRWGDNTLVPGNWVEESTRDHVLRSENFGFGYHWVVARRGGRLAFNADGWGGQIICVVPSLDMVVVIKSEAESPSGHPYYEIMARVIESANRD